MSITTSHPPGAFCWVELATTHQDGAKAFYGSMFGWKFTDMDMGPNGFYTIFKLKDQDVAAGYTLNPEQMPGVPPHWMLYIAVADADAAVRRCAELGGEVVMPAFDVFDKGRMAVLKDPTGGVHNVWQPKANTGIGIYNEPSAFCWGAQRVGHREGRALLHGHVWLGRKHQHRWRHDLHRMDAGRHPHGWHDGTATWRASAHALAGLLCGG